MLPELEAELPCECEEEEHDPVLQLTGLLTLAPQEPDLQLTGLLTGVWLE